MKFIPKLSYWDRVSERVREKERERERESVEKGRERGREKAVEFRAKSRSTLNIWKVPSNILSDLIVI